MGLPQSPTSTTTSTHLYSQALQLKLYQAFIFSIPVLFSVILVLLFYLFYLKRRASSLSSAPSNLPTTASNQASPYIHSIAWNVDIRGKLPVVLYDEELKSRDSQCCVCLAEFEIKEELLQVPSCKHVFHVECLNHWLHSNRTCPLCRCCIIPITKLQNPPQQLPPTRPESHLENQNINQNQHTITLHHHHHNQPVNNSCGNQLHNTPVEGSSSETNV